MRCKAIISGKVFFGADEIRYQNPNSSIRLSVWLWPVPLCSPTCIDSTSTLYVLVKGLFRKCAQNLTMPVKIIITKCLYVSFSECHTSEVRVLFQYNVPWSYPTDIEPRWSYISVWIWINSPQIWVYCIMCLRQSITILILGRNCHRARLLPYLTSSKKVLNNFWIWSKKIFELCLGKLVIHWLDCGSTH